MFPIRSSMQGVRQAPTPRSLCHSADYGATCKAAFHLVGISLPVLQGFDFKMIDVDLSVAHHNIGGG